MLKLRVVACGVFEPELSALAEASANIAELHLLDAGLHERPDVLRQRVQEQIDQAVGGGYDGIVVVYGLCGRGTSGILARDTKVVIPRVHDCISLFLGSAEKYREQFSRCPGTYYITPGWFEKQAGDDGGETTRSDDGEGTRGDWRHDEYARRFGAERADHIIRFYDSWKGNYSRAAFIDTGFGDRQRYAAYARQMAQDNGWDYERLSGDTSLLEDLLSGDWDEDRVFVLQPGERSTLTGDERIFEGIRVDEDARDEDEKRSAVVEETRAETCAGRPEAAELSVRDDDARGMAEPIACDDEGTIGLGIDAGGTYTDCVLYNLDSDALIAKSKSPTTHGDLVVGIREALDGLEIRNPGEIALVALSTTLATNAIVEGRGARPGAIIMSSPLGESAHIDWRPIRYISAEMDITGREVTAPDREQIKEAVEELLREGVDSFAVSGYASVKNPEHELIVREIVESACSLPVVCGHELSSRLNFVNRADTAILNARLLPLVGELLGAVDETLDARGIGGRLMVVKGDGTLISREVVRERPIETILSGPAASVSGAKHLTGVDDAIVIDMGGTTTDTALIEGGHVRVSERGARVGEWDTSVDAADISTIGLGGDSRLDFTGDRRLIVGPRRVLPVSYLCHIEPSAIDILQSLADSADHSSTDAGALDVFRLSRVDGRRELSDREAAVLDVLGSGPMTRRTLAERISAHSPRLVPVNRLEETGIVMRSAVTPTDVLHVTGEFTAWDVEAARLGVETFASLFGASVEEIVENVRGGVVERLAGQVLSRELPELGGAPEDWPSVLRAVFRPVADQRLRVTLNYDRSIVAIGAPVAAFVPPIGDLLGAEVIIPEHADVGNAIGAVTSEVVVRERAVIRPGEIANYVLHSRTGRAEYGRLEEAIEAGKAATERLGRERALQAGAAHSAVRHTVDERRSMTAYGESALVEVRLESIVSGKPDLETPVTKASGG